MLSKGWKHREQAKTASVAGILSQTTCGSKSWTGGQLLGSNCCDSYFCIFILGYWGCQQQSVYFGLDNFVCILQASFVLDIE